MSLLKHFDILGKRLLSESKEKEVKPESSKQPTAAEKQLRSGVSKGFADALKARLDKAVDADETLKAVAADKIVKIGEAIEDALYRANGKDAGQKYK